MNAALGITMLVFGHYILPDADDTTPRLYEDGTLQEPSIQMDVQDAQLRYTTRRMHLPQVPSLAPMDDGQGRYDRRSAANYNQYNNLKPNTAAGRNQNNPNAIPLPPTDPNAAANLRNLQPPNLATPGAQNPNAYGNNQPVNPNAGNAYNQRGFTSNNNVGNFAAPTVPNQANLVPNLSQNQYRAPTASQYISQYSNGAIGGANSAGYVGGGSVGNSGYSAAGYGSGASSYGYGGGGADNRPFNNATPLAPTYSPYLNLYSSPTGNGTVSTFQSNVLPAIQQSQLNNAVNATIGGVPGTRPTRGFGPSGQEQQMGGTGLANPNQFINYGNFNNTGGYYPQNQ